MNLFVLISGYYGIRNISKGMIKLIVDCAVFGAISYLLLIVFTNHQFNIKECVVSSLFIGNWFVVSYLMLLLLAPIIEESLLGVEINKLTKWVILLTVFNLFFGYVLGKANNNGYNVVHFVWLYYIARLMKIAKDTVWMQRIQKNSLWIYALSSVLLGVLFICFLNHGIVIKSTKWFGYNNPLIMISSISLFSFFQNHPFRNQAINIFATGMFGLFILHTTPHVQPVRNLYTHLIYVKFGYTGVFAEAFLLLLILGLFCIFINKAIRQYGSFDNNSKLQHSKADL